MLVQLVKTLHQRFELEGLWAVECARNGEDQEHCSRVIEDYDGHERHDYLPAFRLDARLPFDLDLCDVRVIEFDQHGGVLEWIARRHGNPSRHDHCECALACSVGYAPADLLKCSSIYLSTIVWTSDTKELLHTCPSELLLRVSVWSPSSA